MKYFPNLFRNENRIFLSQKLIYGHLQNLNQKSVFKFENMYASTIKPRTSSFIVGDSARKTFNGRNVNVSPGKSEEERPVRNSNLYDVRFLRKDLREFNALSYRTATLSQQDVIDLKQVFDFYDTTGMGVLLPNDLKLLLGENGYEANKRTIYEIVAEFDVQQTGGISFREFMKAMDTKPYLNETKRDITQIFRKCDNGHKGYLTFQDIKQVSRHLKSTLDDDTLQQMLQKADSNRDGKISFQDFYTVMVKNIY